jgi:hypothetical protein
LTGFTETTGITQKKNIRLSKKIRKRTVLFMERGDQLSPGPMPLALPAFEMSKFWHERVYIDAAHLRLRQRNLAVARVRYVRCWGNFFCSPPECAFCSVQPSYTAI